MSESRREYLQPTPALDRPVVLRYGTTDAETWSATFTGLYHVPPRDAFPDGPPARILDVGANIGLTAAHYRALYPDAQVVAVEMDDENAALAERNAPDATVLRLAVANWTGVGHYRATGRADAYQIRGGDLSPYDVLDPTTRTVKVASLDQLIPYVFGDYPADLVKLDVEGAEWMILPLTRLWAPLVRSLLVELHDFPWEPPSRLPADVVAENLRSMATRWLTQEGYEVEETSHPRGLFARRSGD